MRLPNMTDAEYIEFLERALWEVNRRICEDIQPLIDFMNSHKEEEGFKQAGNAFKWGVYGVAIHAQIALGSDALKKYTDEYNK